MSYRKGVIKNFVKTTGKKLRRSLFFNKVACLSPATLLKKRLRQRCFPVNFPKLLRTPFYTEHLRWLLLSIPETITDRKILTFRCVHFGKNNRSFHVQLNTRIFCIPYQGIQFLKINIHSKWFDKLQFYSQQSFLLYILKNIGSKFDKLNVDYVTT